MNRPRITALLASGRNATTMVDVLLGDVIGTLRSLRDDKDATALRETLVYYDRAELLDTITLLERIKENNNA